MRYALLLILPFFFATCAGTQGAQSPATDRGTTVKAEIIDGRDLTSYIRAFSGVDVRGSGGTANITIRGVSSVNMSTEPLFVIDGQPISGGYPSVYPTINVNDIDEVRVLKTPSETSLYGVRGANGVIEITMKQ